MYPLTLEDVVRAVLLLDCGECIVADSPSYCICVYVGLEKH
jgi:hypothetical protein